MRLDPKYFVPFMIITALGGALLIAFFTLSRQQAGRQAFKEQILVQDSLKTKNMPVLDGTDSLSVTDFKGNFVVLDFWATWSNFSEESHEQLSQVAKNYSDTLSVLAAVVEDQPDKIDAYIGRHNFPFRFVDGTAVFNKYRVPGVPTQLVYNPEGQVISIFFGYRDTVQYDSLRTLLRDG